jgi:hypothetical protein
MEAPKWNFDAAIAELERGDRRQKQGQIELLVSPAKIQAELHQAAEIYFTNKAAWLTPPTKVKAKYGLLLRDLGRTRAHLVEILQDSALLRPLIVSDKDYQGTSYSCQRLLGTFDRLYDGVHDRVKAADQVAASRVRGGRIKSSHREALFQELCGRYKKYTGRAPGGTAAHGHGRDRGPCVRFVAAVFQVIEPEEAQTAKLASAVAKAITHRHEEERKRQAAIEKRSRNKGR